MDIATTTELPLGGQCSQPFPLKQIVPGGPDKLGNKIEEVLWIGSQYAIYRSDKGVYVHFSDCPDMEKKQRGAFTTICPELCELRYLISHMHDGGLVRLSAWLGRLGLSSGGRLMRSRKLYEHNIAQALMLAMEDKAEMAKKIADHSLGMAVRRVTNDNTIRYVAACLGFAALWAGLGGLLAAALGLFGYAAASSCVLASVFGAAGALLSVTTRVHAFELKPCQESSMNYWMSAIRVCMGVISGMVILLLASTVLGEPIAKMVGGPQADGEGARSFSWPAVALLGFVGGFAERFIPRLLQRTTERAESSYGTPVQAALKMPSVPSKTA